MALHIIVTAKQVIDPEMPTSAFSLDAAGPRVVTPATFQPVINGFDENALEAALRLKDSQGATITVVSVGGQFALDIMKKALAMGADALILCQDPLFANLPDSFVTAQVLCAAIRSEPPRTTESSHVTCPPASAQPSGSVPSRLRG